MATVFSWIIRAGIFLGVVHLLTLLYTWQFMVTFILLLLLTSLAVVFYGKIQKEGLQSMVLSWQQVLRSGIMHLYGYPDWSEGDVHRVSKELAILRECMLRELISSWWPYLANEKSEQYAFLSLQRAKFTRIMDSLTERLRSVDITLLTIDAIAVRVVYRHSRRSSKIGFGPEQRRAYFLKASTKVASCLLDEEDSQCTLLTSLLAEILTSSVLLPLLDLISDPAVFYQLWLAILVDVSVQEYLDVLFPPDPTTSDGDNESEDEMDTIDPGLSRRSSCHGGTVVLRDLLKRSSVDETLLTSAPNFKDVTLATTRTAYESKSKKAFTLYCITYSVSEGTPAGVVWTVRSVERRFREFINLHKVFEPLEAYRGIKGPSNLSILPFAKMSPESVQERLIFLEHYIAQVIERSLLRDSRALRRFLAVDSDPRIAFEETLVPWDMKLYNKLNTIVDLFTDHLPSSSTNRKPSKEAQGLTEGRSGDGSGEDEISRVVRGLPTLGPHTCPKLPSNVPDLDLHHTLLEGNLSHLRQLNRRRLFNFPPQQPIIASTLPDVTRKIPEDWMARWRPQPIRPVPFLASFRRLALEYRPTDRLDWPLDGGPWLLRATPVWRRWMRTVWTWLGAVADPIIQYHFETLLVPGQLCEYIRLIRTTLWPDVSEEGDTSVRLIASTPLQQLRTAARCSLVEALPDVTYIFVDRVHLGRVVDQLLKDFENPEYNREYIFHLFQLILEEALFPDLDWTV